MQDIWLYFSFINIKEFGEGRLDRCLNLNKCNPNMIQVNNSFSLLSDQFERYNKSEEKRKSSFLSGKDFYTTSKCSSGGVYQL